MIPVAGAGGRHLTGAARKGARRAVRAVLRDVGKGLVVDARWSGAVVWQALVVSGDPHPGDVLRLANGWWALLVAR